MNITDIVDRITDKLIYTSFPITDPLSLNFIKLFTSLNLYAAHKIKAPFMASALQYWVICSA
jgi:hypothetical protein